MIASKRIAIALGSNLGDRRATILKAVENIREDFLKNSELSEIYETKPWGITDQPHFLNAVVMGETDWKPPAILNYLKSLERELGRTETVKNGPRVIDLDLIIYGNDTWESSGLTVPHPGLPDRDFVLKPLCDVWPNWIHPILKKSAKELLKQL